MAEILKFEDPKIKDRQNLMRSIRDIVQAIKEDKLRYLLICGSIDEGETDTHINGQVVCTSVQTTELLPEEVHGMNYFLQQSVNDLMFKGTAAFD